MVSDLARSLSPASRQWPTRGYTTSRHASLQRSEGGLAPPPLAAKAKREMSREEVAKYNGSFTLADDGEWHTNTYREVEADVEMLDWAIQAGDQSSAPRQRVQNLPTKQRPLKDELYWDK